MQNGKGLSGEARGQKPAVAGARTRGKGEHI